MQEYASELIRRWNLPPYAFNWILIGFCLLVTLITVGLLRWLAKRNSTSPEKFVLYRSVIRHMSAPVSLLLPVILFSLILPMLQWSRPVLHRLDRTTEILLIIAFAWSLIRIIRVLQDFTHYKINIKTPNNLRQRRILTQLIYIRRVTSAIILLFAVGAILLTFSSMRKLGTGLLAGVGIGGIIIGFAAQRSLGNLLAGFQIAFTQPIRIDDEVVVKDQFGIIEEITLTYVVVRIWDERRMVLPINYFIEQPFENWTRNTSQVTGTVFFYLDYTAPVDVLRREFLRLVHQHPVWDKRSASLVVTDIRDNVMELRGVVTAANSGNSFDLRCYLREQMLKYIREEYPGLLPRARAEILPVDEKDERNSLKDLHGTV